MDARSVQQTTSAAEQLWYKDAIIYQLHVKSFFDSNDDGIGDFPGLISRLDYIADLGVNAIWLLPFYPSPRLDDGYDISAYRDVHPDYGSLADFRHFVRAAHSRGIRVITEMVINHTSDQHRWFQRARHAKPGSPWRNFYVWSDTDQKYAGTRVIFIDVERSNWTWDPVAGAYYWHRFYSHQPDLNFDNPQVLKAVLSVMRFWLQLGVDGLRSMPCPTWWSAKARATKIFRRRTRSSSDCAPKSMRRFPAACCSPRSISGRRTPRTISARRTSATWRSTSRSCRACTWRSPAKTASRSPTSCGRHRRSRKAASGPSSCAITTN
jgi:hypothetical protein